MKIKFECVLLSVKPCYEKDENKKRTDVIKGSIVEFLEITLNKTCTYSSKYIPDTDIKYEDLSRLKPFDAILIEGQMVNINSPYFSITSIEQNKFANNELVIKY